MRGFVSANDIPRCLRQMPVSITYCCAKRSHIIIRVQLHSISHVIPYYHLTRP